MVLPDSDGISRVPPYSGSTLENELSTTGLLPALADLSKSLHLTRSFVTPYRVSYNPKRQASWFGLFRFARRYSGNRFFFLFLQVLRCFSSLGLPSRRYVFTSRYYAIKRSGFPIRKSPDQSSLTAPEAYRC